MKKPHIVPYRGTYVMFSNRENADYCRGLLAQGRTVYLQGFNAMARSIASLPGIKLWRKRSSTRPESWGGEMNDRDYDVPGRICVVLERIKEAAVADFVSDIY